MPKSHPSDLSHSEKLAKSAKDSRDLLILMGLLLLIVSVWNFWTRQQIKELVEVNSLHEEVRQSLNEQVTPAVAKSLYDVTDQFQDSVDLRKHVQKILTNLNVPRDEKERILQPKAEVASPNTQHEFVTVSKIQTVELNRLIHLLAAVRGPQGNIWCTDLDDLEPVLDPQGFAVVTTKGDPVYNIKALKFSRFTEIFE